MTPTDPTPDAGGQAYAQALAALGGATVDTVAPDAGPAAVGVETGRYELLRVIGKGGMGQVWLARDTKLGREVALKEVLGQEAGARGRMIREAKVTSRLDHPGVVPVYDLTVIDGRPFYTMRYIDGRTLDAAVRAFHEEGKRLDREAFRGLLTAFVGLCETIAYVHERGVIHRDLKPANVMIGKWNQLVVLDWGLAKTLEIADFRLQNEQPEGGGDDSSNLQSEISNLQSAEGTVIGTPAFMSPEQARGEPAGPASDVYALGAVLYAVLTGRPPFAHPQTAELLKLVTGQTPAAPPGTPALAAICLKALTKDPAGRYPSAGDLGRDVRRWLDDEPVSVHRDGWVTRALRAGRRNKAIAAGLAVLTAAVVVVLLGWVVVVGAKERRARDAEGKARVALDKGLQSIAFAQTQLASGELALMPGLQPLRRRLLDSAVVAYDGLLEIWGDDVRVQREAARGYYLAAQTAHLLGDDPRAIDLIRRAMQHLEPHAEDSAVHLDLARSHWLRIQLLRRSQPETEPEAELRQAAEFFRRAGERAAPEVQRLEGYVQMSAAQWACGRKESARAIELFRAARASVERTAGREKDPTESLLVLANVCVAAGSHLRTHAPIEVRVDYVVAALEALKKVPASAADRTDTLQQWGNAYNLAHLVRTELGKRDAARDVLLKAIEVRERLTRQNPTVTTFRRELASSLNNLSAMHIRAKQWEPALTAAERATELSRELRALSGPQDPTDRAFLYLSYERMHAAQRGLGRDADAGRTALAIHRLGHRGPEMGAALHAGGLALLRAAKTEEAVEVLTAAREQGWQDWKAVLETGPREVLAAHPAGQALLAAVGPKP